MKFPGFLSVYAETVEDARPTRTRRAPRCPTCSEGEAIALLET